VAGGDNYVLSAVGGTAVEDGRKVVLKTVARPTWTRGTGGLVAQAVMKELSAAILTPGLLVMVLWHALLAVVLGLAARITITWRGSGFLKVQGELIAEWANSIGPILFRPPVA